MTIRSATLDDLGAMRRVCLLTGDSGTDATGRWSDDGLIPDVYLEPYLRYPDGLAWVVDEGAGPIGYVVAVADTADFAAWWQRSWVEKFVARHGRTAPSDDEAWLFAGGTRPERMLTPIALGAFPAHLHVDLLPQAQGRGLGRELLRILGHELVRRDVAGIHLGVGESNVGAAAFYQRLGFDSPAPYVMTAPSSRLARA
ncbi:MAG: GNAT family N-acetyltransferase [Knoellia sp.]